MTLTPLWSTRPSLAWSSPLRVIHRMISDRILPVMLTGAILSWAGFMSSTVVDAATYTAIIINAQTGAPLVQHKAHQLVYPASLTKLMTLYLACDALAKGVINPQTKLRISPLAAGQPPCKWGVVPGQSLDVLMAMKILATRSANDVAVALAENLAPNLSLFVAQMNRMARQLGMNHTHFVNPSGWHHVNQKTTAHDLALLLRALYRNFPQYIHLLGLSGLVKNGQWKRNTNALLGKVKGMVAGKTGYTIPAGWNLATITQRDSVTLITVVMGMPNKQARDQHVALLTEAAFNLCMLTQNPQHRPHVMIATQPTERADSARVAQKRTPINRPRQGLLVGAASKKKIGSSRLVSTLQKPKSRIGKRPKDKLSRSASPSLRKKRLRVS